jgi:hypothetical protein
MVRNIALGRHQLVWPWAALSPRKTVLLGISRTGALIVEQLRAIEPKQDVFVLAAQLENVRALAIDDGARNAAMICASAAGTSLLVQVLDQSSPTRTIELAGTLHAVCFDRSGAQLWVSAESKTAIVVYLIEVATGLCRATLETPLVAEAKHELHLHPQDDAVLLLLAAGQDGTFARLCGTNGVDVAWLPTELDGGGVAAGFVGFSADGLRVHLAEFDCLRTHAWPTLHELSTADYAGDFVANYTGAVFGNHLLVDGQWADENLRAVMQFDRTGLAGVPLPEEPPEGRWMGACAGQQLLTLRAEANGDVHAEFFALQLPESFN